MFALLALRHILRTYQDDLRPLVDWAFVFGLLSCGMVCDVLVILMVFTIRFSLR